MANIPNVYRVRIAWTGANDQPGEEEFMAVRDVALDGIIARLEDLRNDLGLELGITMSNMGELRDGS